MRTGEQEGEAASKDAWDRHHAATPRDPLGALGASPEHVSGVSPPEGQGRWGDDPPTPQSLDELHHVGAESPRQRQVLAGEGGRQRALLRRSGWAPRARL